MSANVNHFGSSHLLSDLKALNTKSMRVKRLSSSGSAHVVDPILINTPSSVVAPVQSQNQLDVRVLQMKFANSPFSDHSADNGEHSPAYLAVALESAGVSVYQTFEGSTEYSLVRTFQNHSTKLSCLDWSHAKAAVGEESPPILACGAAHDATVFLFASSSTRRFAPLLHAAGNHPSSAHVSSLAWDPEDHSTLVAGLAMGSASESVEGLAGCSVLDTTTGQVKTHFTSNIGVAEVGFVASSLVSVFSHQSPQDVMLFDLRASKSPSAIMNIHSRWSTKIVRANQHGFLVTASLSSSDSTSEVRLWDLRSTFQPVHAHVHTSGVANMEWSSKSSYALLRKGLESVLVTYDVASSATASYVAPRARRGVPRDGLTHALAFSGGRTPLCATATSITESIEKEQSAQYASFARDDEDSGETTGGSQPEPSAPYFETGTASVSSTPLRGASYARRFSRNPVRTSHIGTSFAKEEDEESGLSYPNPSVMSSSFAPGSANGSGARIAPSPAHFKLPFCYIDVFRMDPTPARFLQPLAALRGKTDTEFLLVSREGALGSADPDGSTSTLFDRLADAGYSSDPAKNLDPRVSSALPKRVKRVWSWVANGGTLSSSLFHNIVSAEAPGRLDRGVGVFHINNAPRSAVLKACGFGSSDSKETPGDDLSVVARYVLESRDVHGAIKFLMSKQSQHRASSSSFSRRGEFYALLVSALAGWPGPAQLMPSVLLAHPHPIASHWEDDEIDEPPMVPRRDTPNTPIQPTANSIAPMAVGTPSSDFASKSSAPEEELGFRADRVELWCETVSALDTHPFLLHEGYESPELAGVPLLLGALKLLMCVARMDPSLFFNYLLDPGSELDHLSRLGLACIYAPNEVLAEVISVFSRRAVEEGEVDGLACVACLRDSEAVESAAYRLFTKYTDTTLDFSTPGLLSNALGFARGLKWLEAHRDALDRTSRYIQRAKLDTMGGKSLLDSAPVPQVRPHCGACGRGIVADPRKPNETSVAVPAAALGAWSACAFCARPLPRCAVCRLIVSGVEGTRPEDWFAWCGACRHGGHARCLARWSRLAASERQRCCPNAVCDCVVCGGAA